MTAKLPCDLGCDSSDAMVEYDNGYKCFSCGKYRTKKPSIWGSSKRVFSSHIEDDCYKELTIEFNSYLKALGLEEIECYWSDKYQAMAIPLYFLSNKVGTAYRTSLDNKAKNKWLTFYNEGVKQLSTFGVYTDEAYITEDLLSAAKLNKLTNKLAICISGTKLSEAMLLALVKLQLKTVYLCLDPDEAGQTAAMDIKRRLSLYTNCVNLVFARDPKYTSIEEIRRLSYETRTR